MKNCGWAHEGIMEIGAVPGFYLFVRMNIPIIDLSTIATIALTIITRTIFQEFRSIKKNMEQNANRMIAK